MIRLTFFLFIMANLANLAYSQVNTNCSPGQVWVQDKIKYQCSLDETKGLIVIQPIACVPSDGAEYEPGGTWVVRNKFRYGCNSKTIDDRTSLALEPIGCVSPTGENMNKGSSAVIPKRGLLRCIQKANGGIARKEELGCYVDGLMYYIDQKWYTPTSEVKCIQQQNRDFQPTAISCKAGTKWVNVNDYTIDASQYFRCDRNPTDPSVSTLTPTDAQSYQNWLQPQGEDDEEADDGIVGMGMSRAQVRPPTPSVISGQRMLGQPDTASDSAQPPQPEPSDDGDVSPVAQPTDASAMTPSSDPPTLNVLPDPKDDDDSADGTVGVGNASPQQQTPLEVTQPAMDTPVDQNPSPVPMPTQPAPIEAQSEPFPAQPAPVPTQSAPMPMEPAPMPTQPTVNQPAQLLTQGVPQQPFVNGPSLTSLSNNQPIIINPVVQGLCQDSHPACVQLCSSACLGDAMSSGPPTVPASSAWTEYSAAYLYGWDYARQVRKARKAECRLRRRCRNYSEDSQALLLVLCPQSCGACGQPINPTQIVQSYLNSACELTKWIV